MHRLFSGRRLILLGGLLILQYGLEPFFAGRVDFLSLLILDYAFFTSWERVPFFAAGIGFLEDLLGGHLFGIQTLSLAAAGLLLRLVLPKLERENPGVRHGVVFLFVALSELLSFGLGRLLEENRFLWPAFGVSVFWTLLVTTALAPVFFVFTNRWLQRNSFLRQYELF